nr:unnamed protein product [Callosobruchus analis]
MPPQRSPNREMSVGSRRNRATLYSEWSTRPVAQHTELHTEGSCDERWK